MGIYQIAGLCGVILYLASYFALQTGILKGSGYRYAGMNLAASVLVLFSLTEDFNLWSAIIQLSWIAISLFGMALYFLKTRQVHFSQEDLVLVGTKLLHVAPGDAKKLMRAGRWWTGQPGEEIATEGVVIGQLHFIRQGGARVSLDGIDVGRLGPLNFCGELTCFSGAPAVATATLDQPSRLFSINTDVLRHLCIKNPDLRLRVEEALMQDTHGKLRASNERARGLAGLQGRGAAP